MKRTRLYLMLLMTAVIAAVSFTSCDDDFDDQDARWYLTGTWQCMQYPSETLCFFPDGTGHWNDDYSGDYEDFDYYCEDNDLYFTWYPSPPYYEDCQIYVTNDNAMTIVYPPRDGYGPTTLYYSRLY